MLPFESLVPAGNSGFTINSEKYQLIPCQTKRHKCVELQIQTPQKIFNLSVLLLYSYQFFCKHMHAVPILLVPLRN